MIFQSGLTILIPIKNDPKEIADLEKILLEIGDDPEENAYVSFMQIETVHYARWFLIDQMRDPDDGHIEPPLLAFTSNYDGQAEGHVKELIQKFEKGFDAIYSHCTGYPTTGSAEQKVAFLLSKQVENRLFWPAMRFYTVKELRAENKLRYAIEDFIDTQNFAKKTPSEIYQSIKTFVGSSPDLQWALQPKEIPDKWWWFKYRAKIILVLACLFILLVPVLSFAIVWVLIGRIFEKRDDAQREKFRKMGYNDGSHNVDELLKIENLQPQNQLTVYGTIKKPYWFKRTTLKLAIHVFKLNGTYRSTKGKLSGIETVHFARWVIFNNDTHVMFLSNYDGAWEKYLSEFIDHAAPAMNMTFSNMIGYPQVKWMVGKGAKDEMLFKTTVRQNQYPTQAWYSAYKEMTVKNMLNNKRIRDGLSKKMTDKEIAIWLKNF